MGKQGVLEHRGNDAKQDDHEQEWEDPLGCSISVLTAPAAMSTPPIRPNQSPSCVGTGNPMSRPTAIQTPISASVMLSARDRPGRRFRKTISNRVAHTGIR